MVVLLLATLLGVSATGLLALHEETSGPLAHWISAEMANALAELHEGLANFLLILIGIHIAEVVVDSALTGHNLVWPMVTGRKGVASLENADVSATETVPGWYAALALAAATGVTWLSVGS